MILIKLLCVLGMVCLLIPIAVFGIVIIIIRAIDSFVLWVFYKLREYR